MHPPTDHELDTYPHVFFTSDDTWNPQNLDHEYGIDDLNITEDDNIPSFGHEEINDYGEFNTRECSTHLISHHNDNLEAFDDYIDKQSPSSTRLQPPPTALWLRSSQAHSENH